MIVNKYIKPTPENIMRLAVWHYNKHIKGLANVKPDLKDYNSIPQEYKVTYTLSAITELQRINEYLIYEVLDVIELK